MTAAAAHVREHGLLMSGPMVRAILEGRKTQTRRVVTDRTSEGNFKASELDLARAWVDGLGGDQYLKSFLKPEVATVLGQGPDDIIERLYARYVRGDRLWVREAWAVGACAEGLSPRALHPGTWLKDNGGLWYQAAGDPSHPISERGKWRRSFHMPRWASRITLEVVGVRVERVQDITEDDAKAEGVVPDWVGSQGASPYTAAFANLWHGLNADRGFGWLVNPWVFVFEFRRVD